MICPIVVLWTKGAQMDVWGMLARHEEIRHLKWGSENSSPWFSRRKNNTSRNPAHACTPRRNPSPPLPPVTAAFAHRRQTSTQMGQIQGFFKYPATTCLELVWHRHLRSLKSVCYRQKMLAEHHHHLRTHAEKQGIPHICSNFCCLTSTAT